MQVLFLQYRVLIPHSSVIFLKGSRYWITYLALVQFNVKQQTHAILLNRFVIN